MEYIRGRYSWLLRPILIIFDLVVVNVFALRILNLNDKHLYFFSSNFLNDKNLLFVVYSIVFWLASTYLIGFYKVYRYTSVFNILSLLVKQFLAYAVIVFAFVGVFRSIITPAFVVLHYLIYSFVVIGMMKFLSFYVLKAFRLYLHGNLRNVIVAGSGRNIEE